MYCFLICIALLIAGISEDLLGRISYERSAIVLPLGEQQGPRTPQIVGCALNKNGTPIRREPIIVTIDGIDVALVLSDSRGIWSYYVRPSDELMEGYHVVTARSARSGVSVQSMRFIAAYDHKHIPKVCAGNASIIHSRLLAPHGSCINYRNPTIVGIVCDVDGAPVWGEVVTISVDGIDLTRVISDERGIFAYTPNKEQFLSEGEHAIAAFCGNSALVLDPIFFRIHTGDLKVPVISFPDPGVSVRSPFVVSGTAEPSSRVLLFVDNAEEAELVHADEHGQWCLCIALEQGDHSVEASALDCVGNHGKLSADIEFSVE